MISSAKRGGEKRAADICLREVLDSRAHEAGVIPLKSILNLAKTGDLDDFKCQRGGEKRAADICLRSTRIAETHTTFVVPNARKEEDEKRASKAKQPRCRCVRE